MGMLEAQARRRLDLAKLRESRIDGGPLLEQVRSQGEGVELVGLVEHEQAQRVMLFGVGKGNATRLNRY